MCSLQPWACLRVKDEQRGWGKRGQDLMAICHDARKGRNTGSRWSKPAAPPLHQTSNPVGVGAGRLHFWFGHPLSFSVSTGGRQRRRRRRAVPSRPLEKNVDSFEGLGDYIRSRYI